MDVAIHILKVYTFLSTCVQRHGEDAQKGNGQFNPCNKQKIFRARNADCSIRVFECSIRVYQSFQQISTRTAKIIIDIILIADERSNASFHRLF